MKPSKRTQLVLPKKISWRTRSDPGFPFGIGRGNNRRGVSAHEHDFMELVFIREGSGKHCIRGKIEPFHAPRLFLIPPGVEHSFLTDSKKMHSSTSVAVYREVFEEVSAKDRFDRLVAAMAQKVNPSFPIPPPLVQHLEGIIGLIHYEFMLQSAEQRILIRQGLGLLMVYVERIIEAEKKETESFTLYKPVVNRALRRMENEYHSIKGTADMIRGEVIGTKSFLRLFKNEIGITPIQYLNRLRIDKACKVLVMQKTSIAQIAYACGFNDLGYFNKKFKRLVGSTPAEFRRRSGGRTLTLSRSSI